jgi:hypothetical protein
MCRTTQARVEKSTVMGGAVLVTGAHAHPLRRSRPSPRQSSAITAESGVLSKPIPPKLTLKQQANGLS